MSDRRYQRSYDSYEGRKEDEEVQEGRKGSKKGNLAGAPLLLLSRDCIHSNSIHAHLQEDTLDRCQIFLCLEN